MLRVYAGSAPLRLITSALRTLCDSHRGPPCFEQALEPTQVVAYELRPDQKEQGAKKAEQTVRSDFLLMDDLSGAVGKRLQQERVGKRHRPASSPRGEDLAWIRERHFVLPV